MEELFIGNKNIVFLERIFCWNFELFHRVPSVHLKNIRSISKFTIISYIFRWFRLNRTFKKLTKYTAIEDKIVFFVMSPKLLVYLTNLFTQSFWKFNFIPKRMSFWNIFNFFIEISNYKIEIKIISDWDNNRFLEISLEKKVKQKLDWRL